MGKVLILLLTSLIVMPMCIGIVSADSVSCTAGSLLDPRWTTCYSNKTEAVLAVPSYITPKDCFVWKDALWPWSLTHPWTVIPGDGCAHWVAHQLNIKHGEGCYVDYSIKIDDIISGRTEITDLRCCKVGDIWTTDDKGHSGIVRQVDLENKEVEVESCSSNYEASGGVGKDWYNSGICWRDGSCDGTACGDNAHCSADCKCKCDAGYGNCDEDWSNGCEVNLKTDSKNCGSCGNDCDVKDGWYCNEANDHNYYFDYYCADSKCDSYHITQSKNCNDYDGWHCAGGGQKRQKWDGYCQQDSLLICDYDVLVEQDCDTQGGEEGRGDGCYAYGNGCEDRDYFCSDGSCAYTYSNRHTDYYEDWIYYCKGDEVWKHRLFHDFYCEGGTCTEHTSWEDDQLVEDCNQYEGWVCDGNIRTYCNGVCIEGGCACEYPPPESEDCDDKDGWYPDGADAEEYRDYRCSDGDCVFDVTDHRCNAGFGNCDGDWSNGCEVNLNTDENNCGSCGNACDPGVTCENGECCGEWEDGCCKIPSGGISGYLYVPGCKEIGGCFYKGQKCCDGNCYECCTNADCQQEGYYCNLETHTCEEEVPEFPAGVTAVFGATLFIFLMMRRKYIRK